MTDNVNRAQHTNQHETGNHAASFPPSRRRMRWHCAWTEHHRERIADNAIRAAGFESFLPLYLQRRDLGRSDIVPCFPRYVLTVFDAAHDDWGRITKARGVAGLICHAPGRPTPLPDHAITELLARISTRGIVDDPEETPRATPDDGYVSPWHGLTALDAESRVRLLIRLFGERVTKRITEGSV